MDNLISILGTACIFIFISCSDAPQTNTTNPDTSVKELEQSTSDTIVNELDSINSFETDTLETITALDSDSMINPNIPEGLDCRIQSIAPSKIKDWAPKDLIIEAPKYYIEELTGMFEYEKENWGDVKSPIEAYYRGNDIGDYFHLNFEDDKERIYDFGFGNNKTSEYELYFDDGSWSDNRKLLNKKFLIYWSWSISSFPCCSGDYEMIKTYYPSIDSLVLIK